MKLLTLTIPGRVADRIHRSLALEVPVDLSFERNDTVLDLDLDLVFLYGIMPSKGIQDRGSDLGVRPPKCRGWSDMDLFRDSLDAENLLCGEFGSQLIAVGVDPARKRNDAVLYGYADPGGIQGTDPISAGP